MNHMIYLVLKAQHNHTETVCFLQIWWFKFCIFLAIHIERADKNLPNGKSKNGDVVAAEPGKIVETNQGKFTPENRLNVENYQSLNVSNSNLSIANSNASARGNHTFVDKLRRTKHKKT